MSTALLQRVRLLLLAALAPVAAAGGGGAGFNFPTSREELQLDIVGLLAVVGESAMASHVQPVTASVTAVLPRLVPAPQSFLTTERPWRLPAHSAVVVGVRSGNQSRTLNFFPALMHGIDELPRFAVRTITVRRRRAGRDGIDVRRYGPANVLGGVGALFFAGLLAAAVVLRDGMAVLALLLMALTSSAVGLGSLWRVDLQKRSPVREVPDGDVVVVGRQGAFLVVRCSEDIARELYFGSERCHYVVGERAFRVLAGCGTFFFMAGVIFMANCTWNLQAGIGLAYIILNGLYWAAALFPGRLQWDLSAYAVEDHGTAEAKNYTSALVTAIKTTRATGWVELAGAVPKTEAWEKWLGEATQNLWNERWDGQASLTKWLRQMPSAVTKVGGEVRAGDGTAADAAEL